MSVDARRNAAVRHALAVCRLLAGEPLTLYQIAERMGFDQRTARRYLKSRLITRDDKA